jgi:alkylhydroperoxidase/carboxymuconolactone decarboxylase family protein
MSYYEPNDLKNFPKIGELAPELAEKFFAYYGAATSGDTALSSREKALIALAVAHALKCPYCIDAYTTTSLERGIDPQQMMEAVHISAAMAAGISLVHSVQMQNHLKVKGVID